jgi:glycosyltransferase involved in cell wall biosynthesis
MKVVHISPGVYPIPCKDRAAAIEEIILQLTNHLKKLGCDVYIIDIETDQCSRIGALAKFRVAPTFFSEENINRIIFNFRALIFAFNCLPVLNHLLNEKKIDIIHTHYIYSAFTVIILNKLIRRVPVIHTTHAHDLIMTPSLKTWFKGFPEFVALKLADHIIAETPSVKDRLISYFGIGENKISIISSGVAIQICETPDKIERNKNLNDNIIILCVGRISKRKNQFAVIRSIPKVITRHTDIKFVFIGPIIDHNYFKSMQRFIDENDLASRIEFTGEISRSSLYELYKCADVFVFPTLAEIQGLVLIEAMAFGLPVIASKIEPIRDIADLRKDSIILIDPNDPDEIADNIILLIEDASKRNLMSIRSREIAESFSWDEVAHKTLKLYLSVLTDIK